MPLASQVGTDGAELVELATVLDSAKVEDETGVLDGTNGVH